MAELLETTRSLSATVQSLEALNRELESRFMLLDSHEPLAPGTTPDDQPTETEQETEQPPSSEVERVQESAPEQHQLQQHLSS